MSKYKIGFIGFGNMGSAICRGWLKSKVLQPNEICFNRKNIDKAKQIEADYKITYLSLEKLIETADIIVFCVEPFSLREILDLFPKKNYSDKLFITIISGINSLVYQNYLGKNIQLMRTMPNTSVEVLEGMTAVCYTEKTTEKNREYSLKLFQNLGKAEEVLEEMINVSVGLSGSCPALIYRITEAIAQVGVKEGLSYEKSLVFVTQTLVGAAKMIFEKNLSPKELIREIVVEGGSTAKGLQSYDQLQIDNLISSVIQIFIDHARSKDKK